MQVQISDKKSGGNSGPKHIGYFSGPLIALNPDAAKLKEIYSTDELPEEPKYTGTDKNQKDWALLRFIFREDLKGLPVEYRVFISKEIAEFETGEGDKKTKKCWYINQWADTQCVDDEKNLFRSFTHVQDYVDDKWVDRKDENGNPMQLSCRKAYKGETQMYPLLKRLVRQDWKQASDNTSLFVKIDGLMRGNVNDIANYIGDEEGTFQPVVGMIEIEAKDGEGGINYYQNCVDGAWMAGWKINEANLVTSANGWSKYDDKANGKGKNKPLYEFYHAVKRNKKITEFQPIHEFDPSKHQAAGNVSFVSADSVTDTEY